MSIDYATNTLNSRLEAVRDKIDAGGSAGFFRIYDGVRPGPDDPATTLLVQLTMAYPSAGAASGGIINFTGITEGLGVADGTATWFRVTDSNGNSVFDGDVSLLGQGGDLQLSDTYVYVGLAVNVPSFSISNP